MAQEVSLRYNIALDINNTPLNTLNRTLQNTTQNSNALNHSIANQTQNFGNLVTKITAVASAFMALDSAIAHTLQVGYKFNKLIETEQIGLKLLIAQNLANIDSRGKQVTALEKFTYAQIEANKAIEIARKINTETPHNFAETIQIYKLLIPQVLKYGGTLKDTGEITKGISVLASAMGVEFQQLLATVDSSMSGQMLESGLKRAMEQVGLTQKKIRELAESGGNVVEFFKEKLKVANVAGEEFANSMVGISAQFTNQWDSMWGAVQKPLFTAQKKSLEIFTNEVVKLGNSKENIEAFQDSTATMAWVVASVLQKLTIATYTFYISGKKSITGYKMAFEFFGGHTKRIAHNIQTIFSNLAIYTKNVAKTISLSFSSAIYKAEEAYYSLTMQTDKATNAHNRANIAFKASQLLAKDFANGTKSIIDSKKEDEIATQKINNAIQKLNKEQENAINRYAKLTTGTLKALEVFKNMPKEIKKSNE